MLPLIFGNDLGPRSPLGTLPAEWYSGWLPVFRHDFLCYGPSQPGWFPDVGCPHGGELDVIRATEPPIYRGRPRNLSEAFGGR